MSTKPAGFYIVVPLGVGLTWSAAHTGCAGTGADFETIKTPVDNTCGSCHDSGAIEKLITDIQALAASHFTEANFPDSFFPDGLTPKSVADLISEADPPYDAEMAPDTPLRMAWALHELNELRVLLEEDVPPDFTSKAKFEAFNILGEDGAYEGCETGDKLDLGFDEDPEGMPPLWAEKMLELIDTPFKTLESKDRQAIKDYVDTLLPAGLDACVPGEDSAS